MKTKKRTEIQIETHTYTVIRMANALPVFCRECRQTAQAYPPEQIALLLNTTVTEICRRIETGQIHLTQNGRSAGLICGSSLEGKEIINGK